MIMNKLLLGLLIGTFGAAAALPSRGLVIKITDGDTVKILDARNEQYKVRLAAIDAPERKQPYGRKSTQLLADLIGNKHVDLDCPTVDRYKRLICTITYKGIDINREMVAQGAAWVYRRYYNGTEYYNAENEAKEKAKGLWNTSEYQAIEPWRWRKESIKKLLNK